MLGYKLSNSSAFLLTIAWKLSSLSSAMLVVTCTMFLMSYVKLKVSFLYQTPINLERTRWKEPDRLWDYCTISITLLPPGK